MGPIRRLHPAAPARSIMPATSAMACGWWMSLRQRTAVWLISDPVLVCRHGTGRAESFRQHRYWRGIERHVVLTDRHVANRLPAVIAACRAPRERDRQ